MEKIRMNDTVRCILLCVGLIAIMAIGGTIDYRDATHFSKPNREIAKADTTETAYDVLTFCNKYNNLKK